MKDLKVENKSKKVDWFFILIFVFMLCYFLAYLNNHAVDTSEPYTTTMYSEELLKGNSYEQLIYSEKNDLDSISVLFGTSSRVNHGNLYVYLYDECGKNQIEKWLIDLSSLEDNVYYTFKLENKINDSQNKKYLLVMESDAKKGNGIRIGVNNTDTEQQIFVNGVSLSDTTICYQLKYKKNLFHMKSILWLILPCIILYIVKKVSVKKLKTEYQFLILWLMLSFLFIVSNVLFNIPDETAHFYRAFEISQGHLLSIKDSAARVVGRELPFLDIDLGIYRSGWGALLENINMKLSDNTVFVDFWNTALYSPVSYIPQALGIRIATLFTNNILIIAYFARLINWVCITTLIFYSIKITPFAKEFLLIVTLLPINIQESTSLAPDGMVVALTCFMISFTLYAIYVKKEKFDFRYITLIYILSILIASYKIVYLPFCMIFFLIPNERFGSRKKYWMHAVCAAVLTLIISLIWLKACNGFLIKTGTNSGLQIEYIFREPLNYILIVLRTIYENASAWILQLCGGSLALLNVSVSGAVILPYFIILINSLLESRKTIDSNVFNNTELKDKKYSFLKIICGVIVILCTVLIFTSLYVQWTSVYSPIIDGIQGRYFVALLYPLYLYLRKDKAVECLSGNLTNVKQMYIISVANICACISLFFACLAG